MMTTHEKIKAMQDAKHKYIYDLELDNTLELLMHFDVMEYIYVQDILNKYSIPLTSIPVRHWKKALKDYDINVDAKNKRIYFMVGYKESRIIETLDLRKENNSFQEGYIRKCVIKSYEHNLATKELQKKMGKIKALGTDEFYEYWLTTPELYQATWDYIYNHELKIKYKNKEYVFKYEPLPFPAICHMFIKDIRPHFQINTTPTILKELGPNTRLI